MRAPGRLVHLAEDEHRLVDDARLLHLQPEVVALAGALAHAAEGRQAAVLLRQVVDELLDDHRLADAGAAEEADLAALGVGREEVDDLDAGLEHLGRRREVGDRRRVAVDRPALLDLDRVALVDDLAEEVEDAPQRHLADGHGDRAAGVDDLGAARQAVGGVHRDGAHAVVAEVLLHLAHEDALVAAVDGDGAVDLGQLVGEDGFDDDALDLLDPARVLLGFGGLGGFGGSHESPFQTSASAPATTSMISWVISAWRARFISSVRSSMTSAAFCGGVAHGGHARAQLGRRRLEQRPVERDLDVVGDEALEDLLGPGLVLDERVVAGALVVVLVVGGLEDRRLLQRQQRLAPHLLDEGRDVAVVEDVDAVDLAVDVGGHQVGRDVARVGVGRALGEAGVGAGDLAPAEGQRGDAAAPRRVEGDVAPVALVLRRRCAARRAGSGS